MTTIERSEEQYDGAIPVTVVLGAHNPFEQLAPITPDYATRPIMEGFNWTDCLAGVTAGEWYLVVFRSVRRATADAARLTEYDDRAYAEAMQAPGFLFYFKGATDEYRHCLSFCLWERLYQAKMASRRPMHVAATHIVDEMYESYVLERYVVAKYPERRDVEWQSLV